MNYHPEEEVELKITSLVRELSQIKRELDDIHWGRRPATTATIMNLEKRLKSAQDALDKENAENPWIGD